MRNLIGIVGVLVLLLGLSTTKGEVIQIIGILLLIIWFIWTLVKNGLPKWK